MTLAQFVLTNLWQDLYVDDDLDGDPIVIHGEEGRRVVTTNEAIESWLATNPPITEAAFFEGVDYWDIEDAGEDEDEDEDDEEYYDEDEEYYEDEDEE